MKKEKRYAPQLVNTKEIDRDNYTIRFIMSTPEVDRHGEVIDQKGWKFDSYLNNPVVLWGHDQSIPAVGKIILLEIVNGNLEGVVQFAYKESDDAKKLFELYAGGYMNAVSVGFMNWKWMYDEDNDLLTLLENELFELSLVNVPANASALAKAKTKGLDVDVVTRLDKTARAGDDRFKNLGEEVTEAKSEDEDEEEVEEEKPVAEVTPPAKDEDKEPGEDEVKAALSVLFKSSREVITASVKELSSRLNDANEDIKDNTVDVTPAKGLKKGRSNKHINSLVRSLLNSKS